MGTDVSIIIINYNTKWDIIDCLKSVYSHTRDVMFEIIVVDNASYDNSVAEINCRFPNVVIIRNIHNYGFAKANNQAAKEARGKYLLFLNPDTVLCNNAIKIFYDFMEDIKNNSVGATGSMLYNQHIEPINSYSHFKHPLDELIRKTRKLIKKSIFIEKRSLRLKRRRNNLNTAYIRKVHYITGADLFMEKTLFTELNGFDEIFFMYGEEMDLQYRLAHSKGLKSDRIVINTPQIIHKEGQSFKTSGMNKKRIMYDLSDIKFYEKHFGISIKYLYKILFLLISILNLFVDIYRREYSTRDNLKHIYFIFKERYK